MTRTSKTDLESAARRTVRAALDGLGVPFDEATFSVITATGPEPLAVIGRHTVIDDRLPVVDDHAHRFVVGDVITDRARAQLSESGIGWLDRRGHVRLVLPGVWVDSAIDPMPRAGRGAGAAPIAGKSGLAVALDALIAASEGRGASPITQVADDAGLSHGTVSRAAARLRDAYLLADGKATCPDLFWTVAEQWHPAWIELARLPAATDGISAVETGTRVAVAKGAALVASGDWPVELYVTDQAAVADLVSLQGDEGGPVHARMAVAPSPLVFAHAASRGDRPWDLAHPVVVALDLANDPGRGTQALTEWRPDGFMPVWGTGVVSRR